MLDEVVMVGMCEVEAFVLSVEAEVLKVVAYGFSC